VPLLCEFYSGIFLTTEEKAWKNLSQGKKNFSQGNKILSQCTVYLSQCTVHLSQCTMLLMLLWSVYSIPQSVHNVTLVAVIVLFDSATTMYIAMLYIGTTFAIFLYLSSFLFHLINLHTHYFSVTDFSDPETYENMVGSKPYNISASAYFFKIS
jgi:hypothetical protein